MTQRAHDLVGVIPSPTVIPSEARNPQGPEREPCTIETGSFHFSVEGSSVVTLGHPRESAAEGPAL